MLGCTPLDEKFVEKATPVLRLYAQAKFLLSVGFWVVCVDEKTSIQVRKGWEQRDFVRLDQEQAIAKNYI